jgi:WD40 repeat protein
LATASAWAEDGGCVVIYDLASRSGHRLAGEGSYGLAFSPDSQLLGLSGNEVDPPRLIEAATGRQRFAFEQHPGQAYAVAFAPDGKTLATGGNDRTVRCYDARTGEEHASYADAGPVFAVGFSPDGKTIASAGYDGTITVRDAAPVPDNLVLPGAGAMVAFSPDGKTFATTGAAALKLWDVSTWKETAAIPFAHPKEPAESLAFAHDGKTLAVAHYHTLKVFEVAPTRERASLLGDRVFWNVAFSPDDKTLASANAWLPYVSLRDPTTLREQARLAPDTRAWARIATFSPDGKLVATGSQFGILKLFDAATGQERAILQPGEHGGDWIFCAAFSPGGRLLASGDRQGIIKIWDVATGEPRTVLKGHTDAVYALVFTGDDSTLATGGNDKTVKLWDVATGQERITLKGFKAAVRSLAFAPDGTLLAAGSWDGTVRVWRSAADPEALARRADDPAN